MKIRDAIFLIVAWCLLTGLVTHRLTIRSNGTLNERHENLTLCAESIAEMLAKQGSAGTKEYFDAKTAGDPAIGGSLSARDRAMINMASAMGASASVLMSCVDEGGGTFMRTTNTQQLQ